MNILWYQTVKNTYLGHVFKYKPRWIASYLRSPKAQAKYYKEKYRHEYFLAFSF